MLVAFDPSLVLEIVGAVGDELRARGLSVIGEVEGRGAVFGREEVLDAGDDTLDIVLLGAGGAGCQVGNESVGFGGGEGLLRSGTVVAAGCHLVDSHDNVLGTLVGEYDGSGAGRAGVGGDFEIDLVAAVIADIDPVSLSFRCNISVDIHDGRIDGEFTTGGRNLEFILVNDDHRLRALDERNHVDISLRGGIEGETRAAAVEAKLATACGDTGDVVGTVVQLGDLQLIRIVGQSRRIAGT